MDNYINKAIQGDCLEVMKGIPDNSVDMILADLPYGTTACKWDTIIPFEPLVEQKYASNDMKDLREEIISIIENI